MPDAWVCHWSAASTTASVDSPPETAASTRSTSAGGRRATSTGASTERTTVATRDPRRIRRTAPRPAGGTTTSPHGCARTSPMTAISAGPSRVATVTSAPAPSLARARSSRSGCSATSSLVARRWTREAQARGS